MSLLTLLAPRAPVLLTADLVQGQGQVAIQTPLRTRSVAAVAPGVAGVSSLAPAVARRLSTQATGTAALAAQVSLLRPFQASLAGQASVLFPIHLAKPLVAGLAGQAAGSAHLALLWALAVQPGAGQATVLATMGSFWALAGEAGAGAQVLASLWVPDRVGVLVLEETLVAEVVLSEEVV